MYIQSINASHPNQDGLFSAINLVAIYRNENTLYVVSRLEPKENEDDPVSEMLETETVQIELEDVDHALNLHDLLICPRGSHEETMSQQKMRETLRDSILLFGENLLSPTMTLVPLRQFQSFNLDWIRRIVLGNFWWDALATSTVMNGFFALQNLGRDVTKSVSNVFRRPGG